ncbi:hypothetical protein [Rhizobium sp. C4]|uniref:hypothetical protein n=1 Tax=Rhizobium sp. C4 TaxID=1349800 RepID=UPI001E41EF6F|nr:hypothetical protein [Rhizobium sp. C4]MCD2171961.1 hypothetical protein [Rhizobium sp. C4]
MSDAKSYHPPLPELLKQTVEQFDISTDVTNVDMLLAGEASRHFPEPRNRRREDAEIRRLRALRDVMKSHTGLPDQAPEHDNAPVHSQFYKQF